MLCINAVYSCCVLYRLSEVQSMYNRSIMCLELPAFNVWKTANTDDPDGAVQVPIVVNVGDFLQIIKWNRSRCA